MDCRLLAAVSLLAFCGVVSAEAEVQVLMNGQSYGGSLQSFTGDVTVPEEPKFFKFQCASPSEVPTNIIVHAQLAEGNAILYASSDNLPSPKSHHWSSALKDGNNMLTVSNQHQQWPHESGVFYIGLFPYAMGEQEPKIPFRYIKGNSNRPDPTFARSFSIQADCVAKHKDQPQVYKQLQLQSTNTPTYTQLYNGMPLRGRAGHQDAFYTTYLEFGDFHLTVTPIVGDPDIYVVPASVDCTPGPSCYKWRSFKFGADSLTISDLDPNYCQFCYYHIAVHPYLGHDTQFDIEVQLGTDEIEHIEDGEPVVVDLYGQFKDKYYNYSNPETAGVITISATAISGDPDIYVSTTTSHPGPSDYEFASYRVGSDTVIITDGKADTNYYINVHNPRAGGNCTATLVAHVELDAISLENGVSQSGLVENLGVEYYSIEVAAGDAPFSDDLSEPHYEDGEHVDLTEFNRRCADAPVPFNHFKGSDVANPPGNFAATWTHGFEELDDMPSSAALVFGMDDIDSFLPGNQCKSFTVGGVDLTDDLNALWEAEPKIQQARYAVTTVDLSPYSTIMDKVKQGNVEIYLELQGGGNQGMNGAGLDFSRLVVNPQQSQAAQVNLTLDLTVIEGNCNMRVGRSYFPNTTYYDNMTYSWESEQDITIADAASCEEDTCTYYIGIFETSGNIGGSNCSYQLTASTTEKKNRTIIELEPDVPIQTTVEAHEYAYFTFDMEDADAEVVISVTAVSGDPDLCVNLPCDFEGCAYPTITDSDKHSNMFGDDVVTFNSTESEIGQYSIGVYGFLNTEFVITATTSSQNNTNVSLVLTDGVPQSGDLDQGDYVYYRFEVPEESKSSNLTVYVFSEKEGDVTVVGDRFGRSIPFPTISSNIWHGISGFNIEATPYGSYIFGVYANADTNYTITAYTSGHLVELVNDEPLMANISQKLDYRYYYFDVLTWDSTFSHLTVTVDAIDGGDPDIYMDYGSGNIRPSAKRYKWRGINEGTDSIDLDSKSNPAVCGECTYFVAIQCLTTRCDYTVTAHYSETHPPE